MIDPVNLQRIEPLEKIKGIGGSLLKIPYLPEYDEEEYDIYDDKDFKKFMSDVEKEVRQSYEYRKMIQYMRTYMDMGKSANFKNLNNDETFNMKIEIHHHPFTLYDICMIVLNKRLYYKEPVDVELVSKEVAELHYKLMVGLVPLTQTEHELVHNKYLFIPVSKVIGRYTLFVDYYKEFMTPERHDVLERIEEYSMIYDQYINENILRQNNIYIDPSVSYTLPKFESVKNIMSSRIDQIKNNGYMLPILNDVNNNKNITKIKYECIQFY